METKTIDLSNRQAFAIGELPSVIPFGRRTIDRMISSGEFPKPDRKIGKKRIWRLETIKTWLGAK